MTNNNGNDELSTDFGQCFCKNRRNKEKNKVAYVMSPTQKKDTLTVCVTKLMSHQPVNEDFLTL